MLLDQGADINCPNCNDEGRAPILMTAYQSLMSTLASQKFSWLINHEANINAQDKLGVTALMISLSNGMSYSGLPDAYFLMKHGAKTDIRDNKGRTVLHYLASKAVIPIGANGYRPETISKTNSNYEAFVRSVLSSGVNINETDDVGNTALMYVANQCNPDTIRLYLSSGADQSIKNLKGETAMSIALNKAVYANDKYCNEVVAVLKSPSVSTTNPSASANSVSTVSKIENTQKLSTTIVLTDADREQCAKNFKSRGNPITGMRYKMTQEYSNTSSADVYDNIVKYKLNSGWVIKENNAGKGIASAYPPDSQPDRSLLDLVVEKNDGSGSKATAEFKTVGLVFTKESDVKEELYRILTVAH